MPAFIGFVNVLHLSGDPALECFDLVKEDYWWPLSVHELKNLIISQNSSFLCPEKLTSRSVPTSGAFRKKHKTAQQSSFT